MNTLVKSRENALIIFFTRMFSVNITEEEIEEKEDYKATIKEEEKSGATKHINELTKLIEPNIKSEKKTKRKNVVEKAKTTKAKTTKTIDKKKDKEKEEKTR